MSSKSYRVRNSDTGLPQSHWQAASALVLMSMVLSLFQPLLAQETVPAWWTDGDPPVIEISAEENNRGPANVGQAKWIVLEALRSLGASAPDIAVAVRTDLDGIASDQSDRIIDLTVPDPKSDEWIEVQKSSLTLGQLKSIALPFYNHLNSTDADWVKSQLDLNHGGTATLNEHYWQVSGNANYTESGYYPWDPTTPLGVNTSMATIGQLKAVFALRFESLDLIVDTDNDGVPDDVELTYGFEPTDSNDAYGGDDGNNVRYGSETSELFYGLAGDDNFYGNGGDDVYVGGEGNDQYIDSEGNDIYHWSLGDGNDYINDTSGVHTINFGAGITPNMLFAARYEVSSSNYSEKLLRDNFGEDVVIFIHNQLNDSLSGRIALENGRIQTYTFEFTEIDPDTLVGYTMTLNPSNGIIPWPNIEADDLGSEEGDVFYDAQFMYSGKRSAVSGTGNSFYRILSNNTLPGSPYSENQVLADTLSSRPTSSNAHILPNFGYYNDEGSWNWITGNVAAIGMPQIEEDEHMGNVISITEGGGIYPEFDWGGKSAKLSVIYDGLVNTVLNGDITVSADVKIDSSLDSYSVGSNSGVSTLRTIFSLKGYRMLNATPRLAYITTSNTFNLSIGGNQTGNQNSEALSWSIPYTKEQMVNHWHNVVCKVSNTANLCSATIYLDGQSLGTKTASIQRAPLEYDPGLGSPSSWYGVAFGAGTGLYSRYNNNQGDISDNRSTQLGGAIDNMALWDRHLSDEEILEVYHTHRLTLDSDRDGLTDLQELEYGLNPFDVSDRLSDNDGDGIPFIYEIMDGTSPTEFNLITPTYIVNPSHGDELGTNGIFSTIQAAINASPSTSQSDNPYTIILVKPGVYNERVSISSNQRIALIAEPSFEETVITYSGSSDVIYIAEDDTCISGFVISRGDDDSSNYTVRASLDESSSATKLSNCIIRNNNAENARGIYLSGGQLVADHVTLTNNNYSSDGSAAYIYSTSSKSAVLKLNNSIIWNNGSGLEVINLSNADYSSIEVENTWVDGGSFGANSTNPLIDDYGYIVSESSPVINAALSSSLHMDIDGELRQDTPDSGADEFGIDSDNDGLEFNDEITYGTNPRNPDTDGDGLLDRSEVNYAMDPLDKWDIHDDFDEDGLSNLEELTSDPTTDIRLFDTDGDGFSDSYEIIHGLDPSIPIDGTEPLSVSDPDYDGYGAYAETSIYNTFPFSLDTEFDGLPDWFEIERASQSPILNDASNDQDGDNTDTLHEYLGGRDPDQADTQVQSPASIYLFN
ncbi:MAG: hypothetical protein ACSHXL_03300 [Bacteroidota bacterium]